VTTSDGSPILAPHPHDELGDDAAPPVITVLSCQVTGATLTVEIAGEADHFSVAPLRPMLTRAAEAGCTRLVLGTSRIRFADSGLLSVLAPWRGAGRRLVLRRPSPPVERLLRVMAAADRADRRGRGSAR
jgi:anti-anti-sigma factor